MGIFLSLEASPAVRGFDVVQYREWDRGYYYRVVVTLTDGASRNAGVCLIGSDAHRAPLQKSS